MSPALAGILLAICAVVAGAIGAVITSLTQRRASSGHVATSEASVLWAQTQALIKALSDNKDKTAEDRDRVIAQRDRLIENYTEHVVPAMDALNQSMNAVLEALRRHNAESAHIRRYLEAHGDHPASDKPG